MSGTVVVIFDNITRPLESGDLCSVLTATTWADRAMRTHSKIALPVKATFLASGNNVRLAGDMPRRCYRVRLDAKCSTPFLRTGPEPGRSFRIDNLKAWTLEHRGELLAALLMLARAWYAAGRPKPKIKPLGSFEKWTVTVGGILELAGVKGFMEKPEDVARLLGECQPLLMVTDPPYGIELDSEWRDRAGLNGGDFGSKRTRASKARAAADPQYHAEPSYLKRRTVGHTETTISGDTKADWSDAFELVPSLQIAYVWHASRFTREVLDGLLRIGFVHHQQIIWDKQRTVLTRTLYWFQHEPCWFVRRKNAAWYGKAGENSTIWASPSPKFVMGGSDETKFDHPTQKPCELMRRPILNHTKRGELVYDPFLGCGTTLAAAELTERVCCGIELDAKYVDVIVQRWEQLSGKRARLEGDGRSFEEIARQRRGAE